MIAPLVNIALGLWLMAAPSVLAYGGTAATSDRIAGPIIASIATVAVWDATRAVGRANALPGAWLVVAPLLGVPTEALLNSLAVGIAVVAMALLQRPPPQRIGGGWSVLWRRGGA
ncbi:MAG: hypothetical protein AB7G21_05480 [Dehalococcoidia bacterium]